MPSDRIRLSVAEAREHAERAMRGIGYDAEEACILAEGRGRHDEGEEQSQGRRSHSGRPGFANPRPAPRLA